MDRSSKNSSVKLFTDLKNCLSAIPFASSYREGCNVTHAFKTNSLENADTSLFQKEISTSDECLMPYAPGLAEVLTPPMKTHADSITLKRAVGLYLNNSTVGQSKEVPVEFLKAGKMNSIYSDMNRGAFCLSDRFQDFTLMLDITAGDTGLVGMVFPDIIIDNHLAGTRNSD